MILSKYTPKRKMCSEISPRELPHIASRYLKYLFFYIKNGIFKLFDIKLVIFLKILKTKSDPNIHQNAPFKKHFRWGMPSNLLSKAHDAWRMASRQANFQIGKKLPPPCQTLATPLI